MIRRELPLTKSRESGQGLSHREEQGFSFVLAPAAADHALELNCLVQSFCFSLLESFLFLIFHTAMGCRQVCSALTAIAQIKPSSSRPTAVMTFC